MSHPFDVLPCGYICFQDDGVTVSCNSTLAEWVGWPKEELPGKSVENIFTLASRIFYNTHFFPLLKLHSKVQEIFVSLRNKSGNDFGVLANAERRFDGKTYLIHCVFIQVVERKKFEEEILNAKRKAENALKENKELLKLTEVLEQQAIELEKQYQKQLAVSDNLVQFSKIISHDLQEPIRKIQIFADLISHDSNTVLGERGRDHINKIIRSGERMRMLTNSLQQYIAIDAEKTFTRVDLNTVIDRGKQRAIQLRQFSDFDIEIENVPPVDGYENQLELLFFHLIDNSIQFRNENRRLSIKVDCLILEENIFKVSKERYQYKEHVRISFSDNGIGFSERYKQEVFELLKKGDSTRPGLGLGLSLVKKVVNNHSGIVQVDSQPGIGTRFEIELPSRMPG